MSALTLSEAKLHLNILAADTSDDAELMAMIDAAEKAISRECGPLEPESVTERVRGGRVLSVSQTPVVTLTSVTPVGGAALSLTDVYLDKRAGVIELDSGGRFSAPRYEVVYQAGRLSPDADLLHAVKELVRHMWDTQRGGSPDPGALPEDEGDALLGSEGAASYAFPRRVEQLIEPHRQVAI